VVVLLWWAPYIPPSHRASFHLRNDSMTFDSVLFALVLVAALTLFAFNVRRLLSYLRLGRPENRWEQPARRLVNVLRIAFGQTKLLRDPLAGSLHFLIFWGFVILLSAIVEGIGEGLVPGFSFAFLGLLYSPLVFLQDLVGLLVVVAVVISLGRRLLVPPKRLQVEGHAKWDAVLILGLILIVMLTMFGQNATRILSEGASDSQGARFVSVAIAGALGEVPASDAHAWFRVFFWAHLLAVLGFLNYLPYSKHLHVLTSIPNVYLSNLGPQGALKPINLMDESLPRYGAVDIEDLTWKQLLDGYTCTECGRCTASCPANSTGKLLSPRKIIVDIRARTMEKAPLVVAGSAADDGNGILSHQLLDNFVSEQELWACTTCMACVQECPVMIEHVEPIVDMRRALVLNESRFPEELKTTFSNLERNFTPWAFSHASRADWAEGLDVPVMAQKREAEVLFWVGCAGAYDSRYQKVSRAFATLMKMAGVDFAILGTEEKCSGDPARRMGNEYLAQTLITENIATLKRYRFWRIVVTCPHCLQSLGKEFAQFGGTYDVVHHSEFLRDLIARGKFHLTGEQRSRLTFHDPCYLGRYHQQYDAPRDLLDSLPGSARVEMPRSRDRSFCCGAGGGRMWMEETEGTRVNIERSREAIATGAEVVATGCPFCMTMLSDGIKAEDAAERVEVKDIAELLLEAVRQNGA
jgi:Fe-S oxidoreductase